MILRALVLLMNTNSAEKEPRVPRMEKKPVYNYSLCILLLKMPESYVLVFIC